MRAIRPLAVLFVVLALGVVQAAGQSSDTGSLRGRVGDATGASLPGVTITATSPAVMGGSLTAVTSPDGVYRLPSLPPGVYEFKYELQGFKPVLVQGVRITVGLGLTIDKVLEVAALQETMTVVGESPIVDTRNTAGGATVTNEILENVPSSRDLWNTVQQVPGVVVPRENVGGFESTQLSSMSVHGSGASAVQHNLNGIDMTLMHQDNLGAGYFSTDSYEEIQVTTTGISAEHSRGGLIINQVVKSGANTFRGLLGYYYEDDKTMASNVDDDLRARGVRTEGSPLDHLVDFSAQLGGPIWKDRIWFFEAFRQYNVYPYVLNCFYPDGTRCTNQAKLRNIDTKINAQAGQANRFLFLNAWGQKYMPNRDISQFITPEASYDQDGRHEVWQGKYERIVSPTMLLEASYGQLATPFPLAYRDGVGDTTTAFDEVTQVRYDAPFQNFFQRGFMRTLGGNFTYFRDSLLNAAHDFKFGVERRWGEVPQTTDRNGDLERRYSSGRPLAVIVYNTPVIQDARNHSLAGYVQDNMRFGRITVTAGLRYEWWRGDLPAQENTPDSYSDVFGGAKIFPEQKGLIEWTTWSPRTGLVWDVLGDSRLVTKFTYGRYFNQIEGNRINNTANRNGIASARYDWLVDSNGNNYPDPSEFGALRTLNLPAQRSILPDLEAPYSDEFSASVEKSFGQRISMLARYTYRSQRRMLADTDLALPDSIYTVTNSVIDPLTGDPVTYYSVNPAAGTIRNDVVLSQFDSNKADYHGLDLVFDRRFDGRWLFRGSVTLQSNTGRVGSYISRNDREIFPEGAYGLDAKQLVRLMTSYRMPWDIVTGAAYRYTGGLNSFASNAFGASPMARVVLARDTTTLTQYQIRVEENGDYRQDGVNILDLRASKLFRIKNFRIEGMLDVFNVFNTNNVLAAGTITASNYDLPTNILTPRVMRFGVRFEF